MKKIISVILVIGFMLPVFPTVLKAGAALKTDSSFRAISYHEYLKNHQNSKDIDEQINVDLTSFTAEDGMQAEYRQNLENTGKAAVVAGDAGKITFSVNVEKEGFYNIFLEYYGINGKGANIERALYINSELPFEEARSISLSRLYANDGDKIFSKSGNEYRRRQIEIKDFIGVNLRNTSGYSDNILKFYFKAGKNTITFESVAEPVAISQLKLYHYSVKSYKEKETEYQKKGYQNADTSLDIIKIQGEDADIKSSPTLYGVEDRTSPANDPYSSDLILLNTIGGYNWRYQGQWITWDFKVPKDGLYKIAFRAKQDFKSGTFVTREIKIDGESPYQEASNIKIYYDTNWQNVVLGGDSPELVFLSAGSHTITMSVTIGELGEILSEVEESVQTLNALYRRILMITSSFPDALRDYKLEKNIPDLFDTLNSQIKILEDCSKRLSSLSKKSGEQSAMIDQLVYQLKSFVSKPDTIPERTTKLNDTLSSMATWILTACEQPLFVDYIMIAPPGKKLPLADASWYVKLCYEIKEFFLSFTKSYNYVDDLSEEGAGIKGETTLWLAGTAGRDQATVIKSLADNFFTRETSIKLNLRLVDMSILLRAVSAGVGPDVAVFQSQAQPLNYGVRSALYDLNQFPDINEITSRFAKSAVEPFRLGEKLYAIPEQQIFPMMFYRKDILSSIGVDVPKTWDDLYNIIPALQKNYMDIGLPTPVQVQSGGEATSINAIYAMLLLQNGTNVYNSDNSRCILNNKLGINAFKTWTELYTKYKTPKQINELNYFRTGQTPIVISSYTLYNQLMVAAPEIRGLWDMTLVPGTSKSDGTIDRSVASGLTAAILFQNSKDKNASWEFIKWWTAAETQVLYGREMETLQGVSARWPTANLEALSELPWPTKTYGLLNSQLKSVVGIPEVPGGYFVGRHVDNAAKAVINEGDDPRETLLDYVDIINDEIINKRKEFGME